MNICDPRFKYVPAAQTDIRKTIKREQKRLADERARQIANEQEAARIVKPLIRGKA